MSAEGKDLRRIEILGRVEKIDDYAFHNQKITAVKIHEGVKEIGYCAFGSNKLTKLEIPDSVRIIGSRAFENNNLTKLEIPGTVRLIYAYAFDCNQLTEIKIHEGVEGIGVCAFSNNNLTKLEIPGSVRIIDSSAFKYNGLTKLELHDGVEEIGRNSFWNNFLTELEIPGSVRRIGGNAFGNNKLTKLELHEGVEEIEGNAFADNSLTNVVLPKSVKCAYLSMFENNPIKSITFYNSLKFKFGHDNYIDESIEEITIIDADFHYLNSFVEGTLYHFSNIKKINLENYRIKLNEDFNKINISPQVNVQSCVLEMGNNFNIPIDITSINTIEKIKFPKNGINLINEINIIIEKFPEENKSIVVLKLKEIINKYVNDFLISRKQPNLKRLLLGQDDINTNLISSLHSILSNLNSQKLLLEQIQTIKKYKNILEGVEKPDDEIGLKIQNILKISKELKITDIYNYLINLFEETENKINSLINIESYTPHNTKDYILELEQRIADLHEKYNKIYLNRENYSQMEEYITNDYVCEKNEIKRILYKLPEDVVNLMNEINKIIEKLPAEKKSSVVSKLKEIFNKYINNVLKNKPQFNLVRELKVSLELKENNELSLICSLQSILYNLSILKKVIDDLETVKNYKYVFSGLKLPNNSTGEKIVKILDVSNKLNIPEDCNYLINLLNETEKCIERLIVFNSSMSLVDKNYLLELDNKIDLLYKKSNNLYNAFEPYLQAKEDIRNDKFIGLNDLKSILENLDEENKEKYTSSLNELKNSFITQIDECIENIKKHNEAKSMKKIEIESINQLNILLKSLKGDSLKYTVNGKLINELDNCLSLLNGENVVEASGAIYEIVTELNRLSSMLSLDEKKQINLEVSSIIVKWLKIVKDGKYEKLVNQYINERKTLIISNSIIILQLMILGELSIIKNNISSYIEDKNNWYFGK